MSCGKYLYCHVMSCGKYLYCIRNTFYRQSELNYKKHVSTNKFMLSHEYIWANQMESIKCFIVSCHYYELLLYIYALCLVILYNSKMPHPKNI